MSTGTKHTPAPWKITGRANTLGTFTVFHGNHAPAVDNQICQADSLADARLIAAAPELFEALAGLLADDVARARETIEFGPGGTTDEFKANMLIDQREAAARAALSKATASEE